MRDVHMSYRRDDGTRVHAVRGVSLSIDKGRTLAVIGESGSGKSTLGKLLLGLLAPDSGSILFDGTAVRGSTAAELRALSSRRSVVFQEPYEALNPRLRVGTIVGEPLAINSPRMAASERQRRIEAALAEVDLDTAIARRFPHELSGGQQQRVGIARALIGAPELIVLDEPTSSLDLSVRAQVLVLLKQIQQRRGLAYMLITHDMSVVEQLADTVLVMRGGEVAEAGSVDAVLARPEHPYTRELLASRLFVA
jgi:ABC-type microcin C transport system duplicated ATPase subunit YejF